MKIQPTRSFFPRRTLLIAAAMAAACGLFGVSPLSHASALAQPEKTVKSVGDVKALLLQTLPVDAKEIAAAMTVAKVGQTITIHGHIPAAKDAFSDATAEFTLAQLPAQKSTPPGGKDGAADAPKSPANPIATVRVLDATGNVLKESLRDQHGLKPGAEVFVTGKVETADGKDALTLTVISMHIPRAPLPAGFFTDKPADNAKDVSEARKTGTLKVGDEVILRGRVGGSKEPFVAGRAVFTLMGRGLKHCGENPDDKCKKPWDYCCETQKDILANSVTVQVVDAKSQVLRTDMKGRRGMKELTEVVVVGKVTVADGKVVVVNATAMSVPQ